MQDMAGVLKFLKFLKDKALTNTLKQAVSRSKEPGMGVKGPKTSLAAPPTTETSAVDPRDVRGASARVVVGNVRENNHT